MYNNTITSKEIINSIAKNISTPESIAYNMILTTLHITWTKVAKKNIWKNYWKFSTAIDLAQVIAGLAYNMYNIHKTNKREVNEEYVNTYAPELENILNSINS